MADKIINLTPKDLKIIPAREKVLASIEAEQLGATIGGIGDRRVSTINEAINVEGNFVKDLINARIDSASKTILDSFTFGVSGALQIGTYVNGVTGDLRISPNGILARNSAGASTLAVDGITGNVTMVGTITASAGSIGGWSIAPTYVYYDGATDATSAGLASLDYPFYAGKKYTDRATAPFRVTPAGVVYATGAVIDGTSTLGGRLGSTLASAIDSSGHFIDTVLNTSAKTILSDFSFSPSDFSGAFKTGDIAWNTTTGAITGGTGFVINKLGIIGASGGVTKVSILSDGNATFAGTLGAVTGTLGTLSVDTGGYIRGGQTAFKTGDGFFFGYDNTEELEQWYLPTDNISNYLWGDNTTHKVGQGFSVTDGQSNISSIAVWLKMRTAAQTSNAITCDLYLMDTATLLPTGASLGQASISGISNTDYEKKTFTFDTPITISSANSYVFVLDTSYTAGDGIHLKHRSPFGVYTSGELVRYTSSWATVANQDASFEVYSGYSGYKWSVGSSTNQLAYNTEFLNATETFIVRDSAIADTFARYEKDEIALVSSGQPVMLITNLGTIYGRRAKGLSSGYLNYYTINIEGGSSNDVLDDGAGIVITEGKGGNTIKFSNQGLIVSNTIGNASTKQTVYCNALSACPLPSTENALDKLDLISEPKLKTQLKHPDKAHFENSNPNKKRKYFDIDDLPEELKFTNNEGEDDIELIRVIGFCFGAIKELNTELKQLKKKIK